MTIHSNNEISVNKYNSIGDENMRKYMKIKDTTFINPRILVSKREDMPHLVEG